MRRQAEQTRYVKVYRGSDALEVDELEQLLRSEGIPTHVLGTRCGAAIGVGQCGLEVRIEVPLELAARASTLIAEFLWPESGAEEGIPAELRDDDEEEAGVPEPRRRPWLLWVVAALLVCGLAASLIAGAT